WFPRLRGSLLPVRRTHCPRQGVDDLAALRGQRGCRAGVPAVGQLPDLRLLGDRRGTCLRLLPPARALLGGRRIRGLDRFTGLGGRLQPVVGTRGDLVLRAPRDGGAHLGLRHATVGGRLVLLRTLVRGRLIVLRAAVRPRCRCRHRRGGLRRTHRRGLGGGRHLVL